MDLGLNLFLLVLSVLSVCACIACVYVIRKQRKQYHLDRAAWKRQERNTNRKTIQQIRTVLNVVEQRDRALNESAIYAYTDLYGHMVEVNDKFCEISGYSREELIGQNHSMLKSGHHNLDFYKELWGTITSGQVWRGEICNRRKDGELFWVSSVIVPNKNSEGKVEGFSSIRFDITEMKKAQQTLLHAYKMDSIGELAGGIAHEINNPVTIILGKLGAIDSRLKAGTVSPEFLSEAIAKSVSCATRIAKVVATLRNFGDSTASHNLKVLNVSRVVQDTMSLCSEKFRNSGVPIRLDLDESLYVYCGHSQIAHVLMNLLRNSYEAIKAENEKWVEVSVFKNESSVVIQVKDSGNGLHPNIVSKLMRPFQSTKAHSKSMGMGLAISAQIAEAQGGSLVYDPDHDNTVFRFILPEYKAASVAS